MGTTAEKLAYLVGTKDNIRNSISEMGVSVPQNTPFRQYAGKIKEITGDATATADSILSGVTAYSKGQKLNGTIPRKPAQTYTPGTEDQTISSGRYLSGAQTIKGDANLLPENIVSGKSIFGVEGSASSGIQDISIQQELYTLGDSFDVYYQIKYKDHGGITQTKTVTIRRNYSQSLQIEGEILSIYVYINP